MPVYNAEKFVAQAIESILAQTFTDFEFVIVNDGSTDSSSEIIKSFSDHRIRYELLKDNQGFIQALNHGIKKSTGKWIARMDADDVSFPQRIEEQLNFLNDHPDCVFLGTIFHLISPVGKLIRIKKDHIERWRYITKDILTFEQRQFADPSVIFLRKAAIEVGLYDPDIPFENPLWYKLLSVGKGAELFKQLHLYRIVLNSLSKKRQKESRRNIYKKINERYDPENAPKHESWDSSTWPSEKTIRTSSIIQAMRMCLVTGDRQTAWKILKTIQPEFGMDPILIYIFIKGYIGVKNLSPFTPKRPNLDEIVLDWYREI